MLIRYFKFFPRDNFLIINFEEEFVNQRGRTINRILDFLDLENEEFDINISSNKASKAKSTWLKKVMKKTGWWRVLIKRMIPSLKIRQIIKNRIQRANITTFTPSKLSSLEKRELFNLFFKDDVGELELLLNKRMDWNK